jgi:cyclophilin family peptidyl-prolyl cis-trans isomerase
MAVLLETSKGDLVVDLFTDDCPLASRNFLKLCKCASPLPALHTCRCCMCRCHTWDSRSHAPAA